MKSPAFQFYPSDFLSDENVALMTNQEVGCYIKLICFCWKQGTIPEEMKRIAQLCGETESVMSELWPSLKPCFKSTGNGRLMQPRLDRERKKQKEWRKKSVAGGKKSAILRAAKTAIDGEQAGVVQPSDEKCLKGGSTLLSSSSSSSIETKEKTSKKKRAFIPPELSEVIAFFKENGYTEEGATEAYKYYGDNDWHDSKGKPVLAWKQKMRGNQFYDSRKAEGKESKTRLYEEAQSILEFDGERNFLNYCKENNLKPEEVKSWSL